MADRDEIWQQGRHGPRFVLKLRRDTSDAALPKYRFFGQMPFGSSQEAREIIDLVTMVLSHALTGIGKPVLGGIALETLRGGRSGAYVFKATPLGKDEDSSGSFAAAVKVAPLDSGTAENANYEQFVRPLLQAAYRPDLFGFDTRYNRAALCYSYFGGDDRSETLTDRLALGDIAALDVVLSTLCEELRQCWYGINQTQYGTDLARYYLERYFEYPGSAAAAETVLFDYAARYFDARYCASGYRIGNTGFRSICGTLFAGHGARAYTSCVLHGDLNSDNVIFHRDRRSAGLIDFQRTGRGHNLQDLVALEFSVRINDPSEAPFSDILEIERRIALGESCACSNCYARAISRIRETAYRFFGLDAVLSTYHFAVASIGLRLMKATDLSDAARARITASVLWACKTLAEI